MTKYFDPEFVSRSFKRLASRKRGGKTHLERTSVLMYFLAIDAALKHFDVNILDLNPDSLDGKNNRKQVELEFTRLVLIDKSQYILKQVNELGKINTGGTNPEKRISSNFFTVPLKKASGQNEPYYYPRRPSAPLLKMGPAATNKKWGIQYHNDWSLNFPVLLSEVKYPTSALDLAIFVCRDCQFDDEAIEIFSILNEQLRKRFTKKMADYWVSKIDKEKIMASHINGQNPFINHHLSFASVHKEDALPSSEYQQMKKADLIEHIFRLEKILSENKIEH
jgi:hypothetical protein